MSGAQAVSESGKRVRRPTAIKLTESECDTSIQTKAFNGMKDHLLMTSPAHLLLFKSQ